MKSRINGFDVCLYVDWSEMWYYACEEQCQSMAIKLHMFKIINISPCLIFLLTMGYVSSVFSELGFAKLILFSGQCRNCPKEAITLWQFYPSNINTRLVLFGTMAWVGRPLVGA